MQRFDLHKVFMVHKYVLQPHTQEAHEHKSFEIIFILRGSGNHIINGVKIPYVEKNVFFLAPRDTHHFEVETETEFSFFKFTELLFSSKVNLPDRTFWLQRIEHILHRPNLVPQESIHNDVDRDLLFKIHDYVIKEFEQKNTFYREIISNVVTSILSVIARNIVQETTTEKSRDVESTIDKILGFIRQNVYETEKMKIKYLSSHFGISPTSLSNLFKKETGESIHQYILNYRITLTEYRLLHTQFTVGEIAYQLGFSDESHLTKAFKKKNGITPRNYKLQNIDRLKEK